MGKAKGYLDIAKEDIAFYRVVRKSVGAIGNSLAVQAQQCVEKLLKGILCEIYTEPKDSDVLRTHSINKLLREIRRYAVIPKEFSDEIKKANGFYFEVRYPGDDYFDVTEQDILDLDDAVSASEQLLSFCQEDKLRWCREHAPSEIKDLPEIELLSAMELAWKMR